ncbi:adenylate kinase 9-like isoform X2 [Aquila chrysaetos chrysaetos]|uniref:adenylate kinase 9-like isoform X2 n=1 Tax=Aquila chrysaetos chrysaetos TaxID=223781 RepID=UPI0011769C98|nr:adenylate kinase 9-like isoform X2 [Aquila chrysaetos chrysaetos]
MAAAQGSGLAPAPRHGGGRGGCPPAAEGKQSSCRLRSYMASQEEKQAQPFADIFDEDEAEKSFLLSRPTCFIIFGKPGSGKKTLARKLAEIWKCIFIEALEVIQMNIHEETEYGLKCQELLFKGQSISEELVTEMILKKIESPEVAHFGYVLSGFPSLSEEYMSVSQQIEKIKNLKLKPDFLINIKCSDYDLCQRISGQKQHPDSGQVYQRNQWDPNIIEKHKKEKDQHEEESEEEDEEQEEETAEDPLRMSEFLHQIVQRPEDFLENAEERVGMYKDIMLRPLEDLMAEQDCQYLIEVDGNQQPDDLFVSVVVRLQSLGVRNAAPITRLQSQQEEILEGLENDELFRVLSSYKLIAHRYRWRRSRWGQACPVALKEGDIVMGNPDLAVSFLGKMYVLSSPEALKTFMLNPRPYLLPPMPLPPCKVLVFGPPFSGRTTICNLIAHKYKGKVLDMAKLIQPHMEESREESIEQVRRDTVEKAITAVKNRLELEKQSRESGISEITADHPEVQAMVEEAIKSASVSEVTLSPEIYAEVLERAIAELMKKNKDRFPGAPEKGGWVADNYPLSVDHWSALSEKGLLPDTVVCLKDTEKDGACVLRRTYLANRDEINSKILKRLTDEALEKKEDEEARKEMQEILTSEEDQSLEAAEEKEFEDNDEQLPPETEQMPQKQSTDSAGYKEESKPTEIILPEFAEDDFPDIPEMEIIKRKIDLFMHDWQTVESEIKQSSLVQVVVLEIAEQTPESLLNQTVLVMEKPFKYHGWELSAEDLDEEAEDLAAEGEDEEVEEEENENEEDEEKTKENKRHMGDTKHFCPVSLKENFVLYPGRYEHAAKYQEKMYYFSTSEYRDKFLKNPEEYVAHNEPIQAPPLRVCLLGTHGAGKTTCARRIADKLGIFHIQFEEYLQELILPKTKEKVGPHVDEEPEEDDSKMPILSQELEDFSQTMTKTETEKSKQEVELTDEEEAIKANLMDNEALPPEVLDNIVLDWWRKEPFRSTGFILDGFPRTLDEAQYLSERGLCPEVAVYIQVEESDVLDRLFPPRLKKWKERQNKKMENKKRLKDLKAKIRDERIARRREELLAEKNQKKQEALANKDHYEATEEEDENENEDVEAILEEEFLEEEEEEAEEEQEIDAVDRIQNEIAEKFDSELDGLQGVQEELEKLLIPQIEINGGRKPHIVCYQIYSKLNSLMENRASIFEKCYPISLPLAHKMLVFSYKFPSSFGQWDPIKLSEGDVIKPQQSRGNTVFPVIHRQYIYFFSSKENKETFMKNPIKYIRQPKPKPAVPVKIAIVGPPKSGKTTVAKKFASVYGLLRLSIGDAIRLVLNNQPESELALLLKWHLHKGLTVPDELAIQALDVALMNHVCNTTGVIIDGYPVTRKQVNLLESARIIPVKIFELEMDSKEVFRRALLDKESTNRPFYPEHDSSQILAIKNSCYKQHIDAIRTYYKKEHQNWCVIDAFQSKWWIWNKVLQEVQVVVKEIQIYLERVKEGKAAGIADLCITPEELQYRLGEFGQYCPVSLAEKGELVDCSVMSSLQFAAEFRGHYYKMASQEELDKFLSRPEVYVPPLAPHPLPPPDMLPEKLTAAEVKALFPISAEMQGYCPVTYLDGKQRYEALVPGNIEYAAKYQDKVYIFESEEKLLKFMRLPEKYWNLKLPHKLPPVKKPILLTALPLAGYLEQGVATSLIKALNEVGCLKPKFPFLSVKKTALLFVACHLKAHNPRSSQPARQRYQRKLARFVEHCRLLPYLGAAMAGPYRRPRARPPGFDGSLQAFLALKDAGPGLA